MSRRAIAGALGLALVLILLPATIAPAEFRGTDMWSNIAPQESAGDLVNRHPLSYYSLDVHVDGGVINGDPVAKVMQGSAALLFAIATFFMRLTISIFDWAFNLDVIGGRNGALDPVSRATQHLYTSTFAQFVTTGVLLLGGWLIYKLINRKFGEAGSGLARAACLAVVALVIIFNPAATIGRASSLVGELSGDIISGTTGGNGGASVSDRLFDTFIYRPWAVLEFGGLERCVSDQVDGDGFPRPVGINDPSRRVCRNVLHKDARGYGGYAERFLAQAPGSDERKAEYEAIKDGNKPNDPQFAGWNVNKVDAPAVDMMQAGGALQRLGYTFVFTLGIVCAIAFLGLICLASLFMKLALLVLFAAAPPMAVAAFFPGAHDAVFGWLKLIGKVLIWNVVYAVVLAAAVGVSAALMFAAGGGMGILVAFVLQAVLFVGLVVKRKDLARGMASKRDYYKAENSTKAFILGSASTAVGAVAAPVAAAGAAASAAKAKMSNRQESAPDPGNQPQDSKPDTPVTVSSDPPSSPRPMPADSSSPPASAGREYSPPPVENGHSPVAARAATAPRGEDPVPNRTFQQDYEHARAEQSKPYGQQREPVKPIEQAPVVVSHINGSTSSTSFTEHLEQERGKQEKAKTPE